MSAPENAHSELFLDVYDLWSLADSSWGHFHERVVKDKIQYFDDRYDTSSEKQSEISAKVACKACTTTCQSQKSTTELKCFNGM